MNLHVLPFGRDAKTAEISPPTQLPARPAGGSTPVDGGQFAKVYDASVLEAAREAKRGREPVEPIPSHVMDEVHAAARLYEELAARGRQIRFDMHKLDGRVVADLVDTEGNVVRPISLSEVMDTTPGPDAAA